MKITSLSTIGLELDKEYLKGTAFSCKNKKINIQTFQSPIDAVNVKQFYTKSTIYSSSLSASEVLQKKIKVPKVFNQDLNTSLSFQLESQLLYPIEEAVYQSNLEKKEKKFHFFTSFIAKKTSLNEHLEKLKSVNIKPEVVSTEPHALTELLTYISNFDSLMVHVSTIGSTLIFATDNKLTAFAFSDISSSLFNKGGHGLLSVVTKWQNEIAYFVHMFEEEFGHISKKVIVTGSLFKSSDFLSLINKKTELQFELPIIKELNMNTHDFLDHSLTLGLALSASPYSKNQINFVSKQAPLGYLKKAFFLYYLSAFLLASVILILGFNHQNRVEDHLILQSKKLLEIKESQLNIPSNEIVDDDNLDTLLEKISSNDRIYSYPYSLKNPSANLTQIFAWLNSLNLPKGLQIENIHYYLEKYPCKKNPSDPFITRLEISCRSENPENLRKFQEKLLEDKTMIVQGKEFKFMLFEKGAKASFILKHRKEQ